MIVNNYYQINEAKSNLLNNTKKAMNQILKKNSFAENIIRNLEIEVEKRFQIFLNNKLPSLKSKKFDDPENSLKYIMLKAIINILDDLFYEKMITISESDKILIRNILNNSNNIQNYNYINSSNNGPNRRNNSIGGNIRRSNYGIGQNPYQYQINPYNVNYQNNPQYGYGYQARNNYRIDYNKFY
jgi:hypothetical protein